MAPRIRPEQSQFKIPISIKRMLPVLFNVAENCKIYEPLLTCCVLLLKIPIAIKEKLSFSVISLKLQY